MCLCVLYNASTSLPFCVVCLHSILFFKRATIKRICSFHHWVCTVTHTQYLFRLYTMNSIAGMELKSNCFCPWEINHLAKKTDNTHTHTDNLHILNKTISLILDISSTQEFRGRESIFETESIRDHFFVNKMSFRVSLDSGEHGPCVFQHWTRNLHMVNFKEKINKMCDDKLLSRVCPYQNHAIWHWPLSCSWKSLVITIQKHIWRNMLPFLGKGRGCSKKNF